MRRVSTAATLAVLAALLLMPAGAAASSGYTYNVLNNACYGHGKNSVWIKVKETAAGTTSANKLILGASAQELRHGRWRTIYTWSKTVYAFQADGTSHFLKQWRAWEPTAATANRSHRIVVTLVIRHNRHLLAKQVLHSVEC